MTISKINLWKWCLLFVVTFFTLCSFIAISFSPELIFVQCDVGQGDAILIRQRSIDIVIDTGYQGYGIIECLDRYMPFWDQTIELVILSHFDLDHVGGFKEVMSHFDVLHVMIGATIFDTGLGTNELELISSYIEQKYSNLLVVRSGDSFQLDDLSISILWPMITAEQRSLMSDYGFIDQDIFQKIVNNHSAFGIANDIDENDGSIVAEITFKDFSVLLTGDISSDIEDFLVHELLIHSNFDIFKVSHHGSLSSSSPSFIRYINPMIASIGVGDNRYGHPHPDVISRLLKHSNYVCRTDMSGDIVIEYSQGLFTLNNSTDCLTPVFGD